MVINLICSRDSFKRFSYIATNWNNIRMIDPMFQMYGVDARRSDTYVANCLVARKLAEKDVRFIKFYH